MAKLPSLEPDGMQLPGPATPGSLPSLRELVLTHHETLYRYAFRLTGNQADAEDLTQQTFLVAQQHLQQVREPEKVLSWLFAVLRSCYFKGCRKPRPLLAANLDIEIEAIAQPVTLDEIDRQTLQLALDELPDEFRIVLLMFYFEGCSYKEIAAQLEIPIGTVMSRLARAKGHLRRELVGRSDSMILQARRPTGALRTDR